MIDSLDSGKERTRRAVIPPDKKQSPTEREELNPCSQRSRFTRFRDRISTIRSTFFVLLRGSGVYHGKLDVHGGAGLVIRKCGKIACQVEVSFDSKGLSRIISLFSSRISQFHGRPQ